MGKVRNFLKSFFTWIFCLAVISLCTGCSEKTKINEQESTIEETLQGETTHDGTTQEETLREEATDNPADIVINNTEGPGAVLHCWNWSYNNMKEHMQEIAQAGFGSIQTSPVQQPKDYTYKDKVYTNVGTPNGTGANDGQWWKLYQPVGFNICDKGESFIVSKE